MEPILPFANRKEAGQLLARKLLAYRGMPHTFVLGLVRGGVAVAREVASALSLPLFPYVVRKIGHPHHREFAVGAIAQGGTALLEELSMRMQGLTPEDLEGVLEEEEKELQRRVRTYLLSPLPRMEGSIVILVDDGAATGSTILAAVEDMRKERAKNVIVALPVCPPDTAELLREKADQTVILATPSSFQAVGEWYGDFGEVSDANVLALLQSSAGEDASS